jgi:hypothetical protein
MIPVEIGRYDRQVATTWNELSGDQLVEVTRILGQAYERPGTRLDALLRVLLELPRPVFRQLTVVHRVELRRLVGFLHAPSEHPPLTAQLLPCLTLPFLRFIEQPRHFYGPREAFRNLRFDEFIFADTFYLRYLQTKQDKWLDQLVATLYRPERRPYRPKAVNYAGDRREDFNEHLLPARAEQLAKLPAHLKQAVLLYYQGCRRLLEQRYEYVFTADTSQKATTSGWQDVLHELAGGVPQLDATAQQGLANVLREMNRVLRRHEERQSQLESQRY